MLKTLIPWSVLLLAPALAAQVHGHGEGHTSSGPTTYDLADKTRVRGEVLSVEEDTVKLRVSLAGGVGSMSRNYELSDFTPQSQYRIKATQVAADDAQGYFDLARFALDANELTAARRSLATARKVAGDPDLGADIERELAVAPANNLIARFRSELDAGDVRAAERSLQTLRVKHGDVVPPDQLAGLEAELDRRKQQREAELVAERAAEEQKEVVAAREKKLAPLQKRLEKAQEARHRGLESSKNFGKAINWFEVGLRESEIVQREVKKLDKQSNNDSVMQRELALLDSQAKDLMVDLYLDTASLHTTRGSLNQAMGEVNKVIAMDPGNKRALAMRGRIEVAANRGGPWGW